MFTRPLRRTALLIAGMTLITGCGARIAPDPASGGAPNAADFPITVTNCGRQRTFHEPPQRVVTNDIGITELMFALGLQDRMAGYVLSDGQRRGVESSPFRGRFEQVPHLAEEISKEVVRAANADTVFAGWNYGFSETERFTPRRLGRAGIDSYVLTESGRSGSGEKRGIMPPLQALHTDLRNLGRIFGVPERAEKLISRYERTVAEAHASVPRGQPSPEVFLYDSGTSRPFTSGNGGAASQIIAKAGGHNVFADLDDSWTGVSWEAVVRADPDVILINDYGVGRTVQDKIDFLTSYPPLQRVEAVRQRRFFALPYAALVEGPRNPSAVRAFTDYLWHRSK